MVLTGGGGKEAAMVAAAVVVLLLLVVRRATSARSYSAGGQPFLQLPIGATTAQETLPKRSDVCLGAGKHDSKGRGKRDEQGGEKKPPSQLSPEELEDETLGLQLSSGAH